MRFLEEKHVETDYRLEKLSQNDLKLKSELEQLKVNFTEYRYSSTYKQKLSQAISVLKDISIAASDMAGGRIPSSLFHPNEAKEFFMQAAQFAEKRHKKLAIGSSLHIYNLPISVHARSDYWFFVIGFPMVDEADSFHLLKFVNIPFLLEDSAVQLDEPDNLLLAVQNGLSIDMKYFYPKNCQKYDHKVTICNGTKVRRGVSGTCLPSLLSESGTQPACRLKTFNEKEWGPVQVGNELIMFFNEDTELFFNYSNGTERKEMVPKGQFQIEKQNGLKIHANDWEYTTPLHSYLRANIVMEVYFTSHIESFELPLPISNWNESHYVKKDYYDNKTEEMQQEMNKTFISSLQASLDEARDENEEVNNNEYDESEIISFSALGVALLGFVMILGVVIYLVKSIKS